MSHLLDGQYEYRGLVFGAGTTYKVRSIEGLEDLTVRVDDAPLPRGHGSVPGPYYVAAKDAIIEFVLRDDPTAQLAQLRKTFTVAAAPEPLTWKRAGFPERLIRVAPAGMVHAEAYPEAGVVARPKVALTAADPRIYSADLKVANVVRFTTAGGAVDYTPDYPKDFPAGPPGGVVNNVGSSPAFPLLRFYGPTDGGTVTSVTLRNLTTGQSFVANTAIAAGQTLTVDGEAYVTGNGARVVDLAGANRYDAWAQPRVPFELPPGQSVLRYESTGTSTATMCVVNWRDTWIP